MKIDYGSYEPKKLSISYQVAEKAIFEEKAYKLVSGHITPDAIKKLHKYADDNDHKAIPGRRLARDGNEAAMLSGIDYRMLHLNKKEAEEITGDFVDSLAAEAVKQFGCEITQCIPLRIITYNEGNYFEWHADDKFVNNVPDGFDPNFHIRKITCITPLTNPEEYEGGIFELASPDRLLSANLSWRGKPGFTLMFPSFVQHRVHAITKGQRRSLVTWFCGPPWK